MLRRTFLAEAAAVALLPRAVFASEKVANRLVFTQRGALPILLTAPHGGQQPIPGVKARDTTGKGRDTSSYVVTRDADTDKIAEGVAAEIKAATGKEVYLVIARFDRQFLDANRPPEIAFDSAAARPIHERYHGTIREFVDEIRANHKAGLLIDVHGQHKIADSLVRGTLNGKSVAKLIKRAGFDAVTGPKGLFGLLEANGFKVFPTNAHPTKDKNEDGGFNGGHTTSTYGSHHADGIDALQFEYGIEYRRPRELDRTIKRTAKSILAFYHTYLT